MSKNKKHLLYQMNEALVTLWARRIRSTAEYHQDQELAAVLDKVLSKTSHLSDSLLAHGAMESLGELLDGSSEVAEDLAKQIATRGFKPSRKFQKTAKLVAGNIRVAADICHDVAQLLQPGRKRSPAENGSGTMH